VNTDNKCQKTPLLDRRGGAEERSDIGDGVVEMQITDVRLPLSDISYLISAF
jgi:hypothetical protein